MSLIQDVLNGKLPEVPLKVQIDNESLVKLGVTALIVVLIILLSSKVIKTL